jgi:hypothetical protein
MKRRRLAAGPRCRGGRRSPTSFARLVYCLSNNALHPVDVATTVRVRDGEPELVDGPFAVTKEILAGYYLLDCPHLEVALDAAARLPMAAYGSVEVRPVMTAADIPADPPGIGGA